MGIDAQRRGAPPAVGYALMAVAAVLLVAGCTGTPAPPASSPPSPEVVDRVVGGGGPALTEVTGTWDATHVQVTEMTAMAVEPDGTLWLVHFKGDVYRVDTQGRMSFARRSGAPSSALAAAAIGPDGVLYLVSDASRSVFRIDTEDPRRELAAIDPSGVPAGPAGFTGVAIGRDATVYVADGHSGVVYRIGSDGRAVPVPGTPPPPARCRKARGYPPYPVGLALTSAGRLLVADAGCRALYHPQVDPISYSFVCPSEIKHVAVGSWPAAAIELPDGRLLVADQHCWQVSRILPSGGRSVSVVYELTGAPRAMGTDRDGTLYVLDSAGVLAAPRGRVTRG